MKIAIPQRLTSGCGSKSNDESSADLLQVDNLTAGHYIGSVIEPNGEISLAYGFYNKDATAFVFTVDNDNEQASRVYLKQPQWQSNSDEALHFARVEKWQPPHLTVADAVGNYQIWQDDIGPLNIEVKAGGAIELTGTDSCFGVGMLGDNIGNGLTVKLQLERCGNESEFQGLLWQLDEPQIKQLRLVSFSESEVLDWYLQWL